MESLVLLDEQRIKSLGIFRTFSKQANNVEWNNKNCAHKFIVFNDRLIIAPIGDHSEVFAAYQCWEEPLGDSTKKNVAAIATKQFGRRNPAVTGAGMIDADGKVSGWESRTFRIVTPAFMREEIETKIFRLFLAGQLNP